MEIALIDFVHMNSHGWMDPYEMVPFTIMLSVLIRDTVIVLVENANASQDTKERDVLDSPVLPIALVEELVNT